MKKISVLLVTVFSVVMLVSLSGCSGRDLSVSIKDFLKKEASLQEETAAPYVEERLFTARVNSSDGEGLTKSNGEPVTVLAAYETASGGEDRIDEDGIAQTYPVGQVMTYPAGDPVLDENGEPETYAGGEAVTGIYGNRLKDSDGNYATHSAGETVTHGDSDIIYDDEGNKIYSNGEPLTYAPGEYMYDTNGDRLFSAQAVLRDEAGAPAYDENGRLRVSQVEIVTDASGEPVTEEDGEAATRVLSPLLPERTVKQAVDEGTYYISSILSDYVFFSAPSVPAANVPVYESEQGQLSEGQAGQTVQETAESEDETAPESETGSDMINNAQLEILGSDLPYFELRFDAEGYGYFVLQDTQKVLGYEGDPVNGANVFLQEMKKIPYPQYKYWDEPEYTLEDSQKWIIKALEDNSFEICSAADPDYCMTVDDKNGIHYANIMMWKYDARDQQKFRMQTDTPVVNNMLEEGQYFVRSGLSDWMMMSIGDFNYDDERKIYLYHSDGLNGQMFSVSYDEYGLATITHADSTKALSIENSEAVNNNSVFQYESDGDAWQKWILDPVEGESGFIIRSVMNVSEVLNVQYGVAAEVQTINLYWEDGTPGQKWYFTTEPPENYGTQEGMLKYAQQYYSDTGYLILVNSITNHLGVYIGYKGHWEELRFWDCVTGKPSTPTVKGEYTIIGRLPSFDGDTDAPAWYTCYFATCFYPSYYIHSIVYYKGTEDIMDASMGVNVSHGCVRLYIENAQWVYENIPDGTKLVSY